MRFRGDNPKDVKALARRINLIDEID